MNFGVLCSFDKGECTGPHKGGNHHMNDWQEYGFAVGCVVLGEFPHPDWKSAKQYPSATWYSFPAQCPLQNYKVETKECEAAWPGGMCSHPDGSGTCTYHMEFDGEINIDELVGITPRWRNRAAFCSQCHYG